MAHITMNRRIGTRTKVRVPVSLRRQPRGFSLRAGRRTIAVITDVSVTGLEVECAPISGVALRDRVLVEADKGVATAEVRRIENLDKKRVRYGVRLVEVDPAFATAMNQIATGLGSDEVDWRWVTAR